ECGTDGNVDQSGSEASLNSLERNNDKFGSLESGSSGPPSRPGSLYTDSTDLRRSLSPKSKKKKKGILKAKTSYGADDVSEGTVSKDWDDKLVLGDNTVFNEHIADFEKRILNIAHPIPETGPLASVHVAGPGEKTFDLDLKLPSIVPLKPPRARDVILSRQPNGGFGFTLRRSTVRGTGPTGVIRRQVHFAEPSTTQKENSTGLLPGDRLVEVNGTNIENTVRDEIIGMIRGSGESVTLKVQPIPELIELSHRSGADGSEIHLEDQLMKTGSLALTASFRAKRGKAKSEDQLQIEKDWLAQESVWLTHKGGFAAAKRLKPEGDIALPEGRLRVRVEHNGEVLEIDEEDIEKTNPPQYDRAEDIATLLNLNESGALHTIRQRYGANLIHTFAGRNMVVVNPMHQLSIYSEKHTVMYKEHATAVIQMFKGCKQEDMPPHIYATAQSAYRTMLASRHDQSIVFLGRSGSGKSWNAKHTLQYLAQVAGTVNSVVSVDKIQAVGTLIDAFCGARTNQNTVATRCAQITSLDFDHVGQVAAASVQILLLDKYRVIRRPDQERNFNIFYMILAGADETLSKNLFLNRLAENNKFVTPAHRTEEKQTLSSLWTKVLHACNILGISAEETMALWCVVAAIIHLGAAGATKGTGSNKAQFLKPSEAQKAASLLGTSVEELSRNIFSSRTSSGTPTRGGRLAVAGMDMPGGTSDPNTGAVEALEGMVVGLYAELVNAVVSLINRALSSTYRIMSSIMLVDILGFQDPSACGRQEGASFRDLCDNYAQERLQLLFHENTFTSQQDKYAQENIDCQFEKSEHSPAPMVDLIDRQQGLLKSSRMDLRDTDQKGILWLLDEESIFPGATDESFMERLYIHYGEESIKQDLDNEIVNGMHDNADVHNGIDEQRIKKLYKFGDGLIQRCRDQSCFVLNHLQGSAPIQYNAGNWLKAAREHPVVRMGMVVLQESQKTNISALFTSLAGTLPSTMVGSVAGIEGSKSLRRASSIRRAWSSGTAAIKRKSVCLQIKFQVDGVIDSLRRTKLHFVFCLLPHADAGLCELKVRPPSSPSAAEGLMDVPLIKTQIRGYEVLESTRQFRFGYPESMLFTEFRRRFEILVPAEKRMPEPILDERKAVEDLMKQVDIVPSSFRIGLSQIFFRPGALSKIEDQRDVKVTNSITAFQAEILGYLARRKLKQLKIQRLAITCIQRNVCKFMVVRTWPWWRLVTKVTPLLDVHRTEEELKMKDIELEQLRTKVEKLDKERTTLKINCDKLESKLTEITADLADEHSTATHASEILEAETAERMRLEKELKELKAAHGSLQRKAEKLEMENMESRMLRSSYMDGDMGSSDEESDSIYRAKYEQARKEVELTKKRLNQDHEEEMENMAAAKKAVERRYMEAQEDIEEHKRQVAALKRKSQKLIAESQDMRLHLETQQTRNADLEKKQRKHDGELHKVQQELQHDKNAKERIQREKESLEGENYVLKQQVEDVKTDLKIKEDQCDQLNQELLDVGSHGSKEVMEVANLKKTKRTLEAKIADQEDELDDQAGQIQMLEQAKLRLEMQLEKQKQAHQKELEIKDEEVESTRGSCQNKIKQLEIQLEEDYSERQHIMKEKRNLEQKVAELQDRKTSGDKDTERRLRKDLKKTKVLLNDAQLMLDKQKAGVPSVGKLKQLKNELEDAQFALQASGKAKQNVESELQDLHVQLDDITRTKVEAEERASHAQREKAELESQIEDNEEDYNELLKKHKALANQMSLDHGQVMELQEANSRLIQEKQELDDKVYELSSKVEFQTNSMVDKNQVSRLESKIRDLETKLDLEHTTKLKIENTLERLKDSVDHKSSERDQFELREQRAQDEIRRLQREMRETKDDLMEIQRKESDASKKKHDLEAEIVDLEEANEKIQSDLKLAFKRIADLQGALEDNIGSDDSDLGSGSDSDDDVLNNSWSPRYSSHSASGLNRYDSTSSVESTPRYSSSSRRRIRSPESVSEKSETGDSPRKAKYVVNSGSSDDEEIEPRSTSRPSSMYSEDSKDGGASVDSGGAPEMKLDSKTETKIETKTESKTDMSAELALITRGADPEKQRRARRMTKKGLAVNPDYL
ncbi:LOW QUALITY PROTEIN: unconventional myosin-XVIIIa-like, partial [Amphiura filiformis]|uniref:LOW QUALITY PROTEIN: unconventional myosin-XVIIIa-like n=1 Tax=Amphiura filiformis TaxID=82378 RepID=UPI003B21DF9C